MSQEKTTRNKRIARLHFKNKKSIRVIAQKEGIDPSTVQRIITRYADEYGKKRR